MNNSPTTTLFLETLSDVICLSDDHFFQDEPKRLILKHYQETELPSVREIIERSRKISASETSSVLSKKKL